MSRTKLFPAGHQSYDRLGTTRVEIDGDNDAEVAIWSGYT